MEDMLGLRFESVICNELGEIVARCNDLTFAQVKKILEEHEEYYINTVQVKG
jgi:hypothetical protein